MQTLMIASLILNLSTHKMMIQSYQAVPEMDYQTVLSLPNPETRVFLDCQSFFNTIHYQTVTNDEWNDNWSLIVGGGICEEVSQYTKDSIDAGSPFCLSVDLEERTVGVASEC